MSEWYFIGLQFLKSNGESSQKIYDYVIKKDTLINSTSLTSSNRATYLIKNEQGYDYRNSPVVIAYLRRLYGAIANEDYREIISLEAFDRPAGMNIKYPAWSKETQSLMQELLDEKLGRRPMSIDLGTPIVREIKEMINKKESNKMFSNIKDRFYFGKAHGVKMSVYGAAFKGNDGGFYAFSDDGLIEATGMTMEGDFFYVMPAAISTIAVGDIIFHRDHFVRVTEVQANGYLVCIDPMTSEVNTIAPARSPFGFDFVGKLVNMLGDFNLANQANSSNPFGNLLPFILMQDGMKDDQMLPMMMMMMMQGGQLATDNTQFNPLMLAMLLNK